MLFCFVMAPTERFLVGNVCRKACFVCGSRFDIFDTTPSNQNVEEPEVRMCGILKLCPAGTARRFHWRLGHTVRQVQPTSTVNVTF